jgi:hypothetical protein
MSDAGLDIYCTNWIPIPLITGRVGLDFFRDTALGVLLVDWAKPYTTATADVGMFEVIEAGTEIPGGSFDQSP